MHVSRWQMVKTLFRIGATSYGGPAIVAQIREVTVLEKKWLSEDEFRESLAFCQMMPGPVAVQTSAHIGWRLYGGMGVFLGLTSYSLPCFLLMLGLSAGYFRYEQVSLVATAFQGLGAAVTAIVVQSILSMTQSALQDWRGLLIAAAAAVGFFTGQEVLLVLLAAALAGVLLGMLTTPAISAAADPPPATPATPAGSRYHRALLLTAAVAVVYAGAIVGSGWISPQLPALGVTMTKINLVAFGGGYTAVALMFQEAVQSAAHHWLTAKEFNDGLALGQITPGPVIMTATFIGYRVGGWVGACFATVCIFLPSSLLMTLAAPHFARIRHLRVVQFAVRGLLAAFIAMLLHVLADVAKAAFRGPTDLVLAAAAIVALRLKVNVIWVVVGSVLVSLALAKL
ncbi:MAG TPA: chromate efflux transporter [Thermoanaerobaculaceae bacterium]|nr:chromate efflux transporter [Thermoanaerobaculaceae bacterium]